MNKNEKMIPLFTAILPIIILVILLAINVSVYEDDSLNGSNQFILLIGGAIASLIGFKNKVPYKKMINKISENLKATTGAILILLFVGALGGTWLISGIIPAMIYYGLQIINPTFFLPSCILISAFVALATGSSWSTSATIGIALIGIGKALGFPVGMVAGAVISGAYFGDKLSPLSDTTNLASAMAKSDIFSHIRYMLYTTIPSISITIITFFILGFFVEISSINNSSDLIISIKEKFNLNPILFFVPGIVVFLIIKKTTPLIALMIGTILGGVFALIFQPTLVYQLTNYDNLNLTSGYIGIMNSIIGFIEISTDNEILNDLFKSGGMNGMLGTIWLVICAMVFGGIMDSIGALNTISYSLLKIAKSTFGLVSSTAVSCLTVNLTASDQYLSIVIPGKMFTKSYEEKKLAPENLSRTLEDSGTVTSVLIPWNTCGAYQSGVLGVSVFDYFIYAIFNWLSPIMTLFYAYFKIKINKI